MRVFQKGEMLVVVMEPGEMVMGELTALMKERGIGAARIEGIGAVNDPLLGFFHLHSRTYEETRLSGEFELLSLLGNVTIRDGEPLVHLHAVLGGEDLGCSGGHLFEAQVAVTVEIFLQPLPGALHREVDDRVGLALISRDAESL